MRSVMSSDTSSRTGEPNRRAGQLAFERLQQVLVAIFVDFHIGVAGDAERVVLGDLHPGEQHRQEGGDQLFHREEPHHALDACTAAELDEPIDIVGHFDPGEVLAAVVGMR